jgi:16S rRNA (cytidine1402-2'-O)-methyltransferase
MSKLYIVSTPIGNLGDFTYRAVEVLGTVDRILAEDTRRTTILLRHYGIRTPLYSAHAHNEQARSKQILQWLDRGEQVALVSDAGTPLLSDPGARIVRIVLEAGHEVIPVPGPSALLAALVGAGLEPEPFTFFGFLPRSGRERQTRLQEIATLGHTAVVYEAPGRLLRLLDDLEQVCGAERQGAVARELTKVHETFVRGTLQQLRAYYEAGEVRGEVVVLIAGAVVGKSATDREAEARSMAAELLAVGDSPRDVARKVAQQTGLTRNRSYEITLSLAPQEGEVTGE